MRTSSGSPTLLLVPTEFELGCLAELGGFEAGSSITKICGFGPIAAAACTAEYLAALRPARVVLLGIAGTYDCRAVPIGTAAEFDEVASDGVGAGESARFRGPPALGFPQWAGAGGRERIFDRLALDSVRPAGAERKLLLSACAASDTREMAESRRARFPSASAEDMEGFGVALACALSGVPLRIVRGISNAAGDRDRAGWRIREALAAARAIAIAISCSPPRSRDEG